MRALRIVVVEDLDDTRELVAELLRLQGHDVKVARDGASGIALICTEQPDVALVDIGLPIKNGYEVAREVRRVMRENTPRLVAISGYAQEADRDEAIAAGFDAHVAKPASTSELMAAMCGD